MKKIYILSILFFQVLYCMAQKNDYIPFPSDFIVYSYKKLFNSERLDYSTVRYEIHGDTILNGIPYFKYYVDEDKPDPTTGYPLGLTDFKKFGGGIRNDTLAKKVYFYSSELKTEELLYDFDLQVGDTLFKNDGYHFYRSLLPSPSIMPVKIDTVWVSSIDSVFMLHDGRNHRRFNLMTRLKYNNKYYQVSSGTIFNTPDIRIMINPLIEGVGTPYTPISTYYLFEYAWEFESICVSINQYPLLTYNPSTSPPFIKGYLCNSIITEVAEEKNTPEARVFPNPTSGTFLLNTPTRGKKTVEILDMLGNRILKLTVETTQTTIDLTSVPSGIYFIRIYNLNGSVNVQKLVIN